MEKEKEVRYLISKEQIGEIIKNTTPYKERMEMLDITCGYDGFNSYSKYGFICRIRQKGNNKTLEVKNYINKNGYKKRYFIGQSCPDYEAILIDDGSVDNSGMICDDYADHYAQICVVHTENKGPAAARKKGAGCAAGEYIMFVDADDYLMNDAVETLYNGVIKYNADVSIASFVNISKKGRLTYNQLMDFSVKSSSVELASMLLNEKLPFSLCAKLFSKDLFKNVIHQNALMMGEDAYVTLQLINEAERVVILPHVVLCLFATFIFCNS